MKVLATTCLVLGLVSAAYAVGTCEEPRTICPFQTGMFRNVEGHPDFGNAVNTVVLQHAVPYCGDGSYRTDLYIYSDDGFCSADLYQKSGTSNGQSTDHCARQPFSGGSNSRSSCNLDPRQGLIYGGFTPPAPANPLFVNYEIGTRHTGTPVSGWFEFEVDEECWINTPCTASPDEPECRDEERGCLTDAECQANTSPNSYCKNYDHLEPPFTCQGCDNPGCCELLPEDEDECHENTDCPDGSYCKAGRAHPWVCQELLVPDDPAHDLFACTDDDDCLDIFGAESGSWCAEFGDGSGRTFCKVRGPTMIPAVE